MTIHELAGKKAPREYLTNVPNLISSYYTYQPEGKVNFGTSGHRGTSLNGTFNELHIAAIAQSLCEYRASKNITGPLYLGFDTHALSEPAFRTTLEVFAANKVETVVHRNKHYTPTPVISFFILEYNKNRKQGFADGVVITPSHNPPEDGGFKYNPPHGGPADLDVTSAIEIRANEIIEYNQLDIKRLNFESAMKAPCVYEKDFITPFVDAIASTVDMQLISSSGIRLGVDPMGGSGIHFWEPIAKKYNLNLEIVNDDVDPSFSFMTLDYDGKIRMDCSSVYAMSKLISMANKFDIAWGNDPDFDRHGIVCPTGLMNPNHYLVVAIWYLIQNRPAWRHDLKVGKTLVSSSLIDRVVKGLGRELYEVPVGFKWFVQGLLKGDLAFGGEESAGASFLRNDGSCMTTDKDGFCLTLLAAEMLAKTKKTPQEIYKDIITKEYGNPHYKRIDGPITLPQKSILKEIQKEKITNQKIAGLQVKEVLTEAPGNKTSIGGLKVILQDGSWFAIRPSGTEPKMKFYIESFSGENLINKIYEDGYKLILGKS